MSDALVAILALVLVVLVWLVFNPPTLVLLGASIGIGIACAYAFPL